MNLGLDGKTAIATGGSAGIGLACAMAVVSEGVHTAIAALLNFTKGVSRELIRHNIRINAILPGPNASTNRLPKPQESARKKPGRHLWTGSL